MYWDEDGIATKQSQAVYDARMRILLYATSLLSSLGFGASILNGDYAGEDLRFTLSLKPSGLLHRGQISVGKLRACS